MGESRVQCVGVARHSRGTKPARLIRQPRHRNIAASVQGTDVEDLPSGDRCCRGANHAEVAAECGLTGSWVTGLVA